MGRFNLWKRMHSQVLRSHTDSISEKGFRFIFGRVFCKKGCDADGDTWEECLAECNEICYKDPVLKDQQWSAFIDRSPGAANYSEDCFNACRAGCGYKFEIPSEKVNQVHPNRPAKPPSPPIPKPSPPAAADASAPSKSSTTAEDILSASA